MSRGASTHSPSQRLPHNILLTSARACTLSSAFVYPIFPNRQFLRHSVSSIKHRTYIPHFRRRRLPTSCAQAPTPLPPPSSPSASSPPHTSSQSVTRQLLTLALPALGALALDPLLSLVDTAFVGRLGVSQLAGVSIATLLLNLSFSLFNFLCISVTPLVANAVHARPDDTSAGSRSIAVGIQLAFVLGTATAVTLFSFASPLAKVLTASPQALPHVVVYLRARAVAIPIALSTFVANGALRALRDLRTPFVVALIANVANMILDVVLMFYFRLGVLGAAAATSISQILAFVLLCTDLLRRRRLILIDLFRVPSFSDMAPMLSAGVLLAVRTGAILTTVTYATAVASTRGEQSLAAFELTRQLWVFFATMLDSLAAAAQALVAAAMAARAVRLARRVATRAIVISAVAATAISLPAILTPHILPPLFTTDPDVMRLSAMCIRVAALCAPINGMVYALDGVLSACADYRYLAGAIAVAAMVACTALTMVRVFSAPIPAVWGALNVLMIARAAVLFARLLGRHGPMAVGNGNHNGSGTATPSSMR